MKSLDHTRKDAAFVANVMTAPVTHVNVVSVDLVANAHQRVRRVAVVIAANVLIANVIHVIVVSVDLVANVNQGCK